MRVSIRLRKGLRPYQRGFDEGRRGKHENEGFHGKIKGKDEVSFGRRGKKGKWW